MSDQGTLRVMRTGGGLTHRNAVRKRIVALRIERLTFLSDHGLLTDIAPESTDWKIGGTRYVELEGGAHWQPIAGKSFPASVTKGTTLRLELDLSVDPPDADPIEGTLHGEPTGTASSPELFMVFESALFVGGSASVKLSLTANGALPNEVFDLDFRSIAWKATIAGETFDLGATGPHHLYVTYDTPNVGGVPMVTPFDAKPAPLEDGITDKRMSAAVTLTDKRSKETAKTKDAETDLFMDRNDPHVIAKILIAAFAGYSLQHDPTVPEVFNQPGYINGSPDKSRTGAWPMFDFITQSGECQAIVRFVRGVLMQIGCPGDVELVVVYAHAAADNGAIALEDRVIPRDPDATKYLLVGNKMELVAGLNRNNMRIGFNNGVVETQFLSLADSAFNKGDLKVGDLIPAGTTLNAFEACLKFTFGGKTRYYGGGVPNSSFKSAQEVIGVFSALVWTTPIFDITGLVHVANRVEEIVHKY